MNKTQKQRSIVLSKETLFNNQKTAVEGIQKLVADFQSAAEIQKTVSLAMPLNENVTQVLFQLQAMARQAQVNISTFAIEAQAFEPSPEPLVKRLGTLGLNLTIQGPYQGIKQFLKFLETNVRVANLKNADLTLVNKTKFDDQYSLNLKAEVYYQEQK